jgi:cell division protein FtsN
MKKTILIISVLFAVFQTACNSKKEVKTDKEKGTQVTTEHNTDFDMYHTEKDTTKDTLTVKVINKDTLAKNTVKKQEKKVVKDNVKKTENEPVLQENQDGTLKKVSEKELNKATTKEHIKKFYIVTGSFKEMPNAIALRKFFKDKGYTAMILYPYNGYNRVATGSFSTREQAQKEIRKFRTMNLTYQGKKIEYWLIWR